MPSNLLKLEIPLALDARHSRNIIMHIFEVHPQQPLSRLARQIYSVLLTRRKPHVWFRAVGTVTEKGKTLEEMLRDVLEARYGQEEAEFAKHKQRDAEKKHEVVEKNDDKHDMHDKHDKHDKLDKHKHNDIDPKHENEHYLPCPVRWSHSALIGDFIRDVARTGSFSIDIKGFLPILVSLPDFNERTQYLRRQLRRTARELDSLAQLKRECDTQAQRDAEWLGRGFGGGLIAWCAGIYYFTFCTEYGWDTMEPITVSGLRS